MTVNSVDDCLEDTTLHTVAYKFQSERGEGVHMHPPAYGPVKEGVLIPGRGYTVHNSLTLYSCSY